MADNNGGDGGSLARILTALENKVVLLIASALIGITGNQLVTQIEPGIVRPDPFTGSMAKELESRLREYIDLKVHPHDAHLARSNAGWAIIYEMRQDIAVIKERLNIHERDQP